MRKKIRGLLCVMLVLVLCTGCSLLYSGTMPFNGEAQFHDIWIVIPERFIRDSTQSSDDVWVFERGNYKEYIIMSRTDIQSDEKTEFESAIAYMKSVGAEYEMLTKDGIQAAHFTYDKEGVFCQELVFPYKGLFYAIALRGGDENGFKELINSIVPIADVT